MKKINFVTVGLTISLILVLGVNVAILVRYRQDSINYQTQIANLESEVVNQRDQKNTIRNLWEQQAASSDKLVIAQSNLLNRIADLELEIKRSIRFVNSNPEILSTISEERLTSVQSDLNAEIVNVEEKTQENADIKDNAKNVIDALYLNDKEEQNNRANPDDATT